MELKELEQSLVAQIKATGVEMAAKATEALDETKKLGTITTDMNTKLTEQGTTITALKADLQEVQQKMAAGFERSSQVVKTIGDLVIDSDQYKAVKAAGGALRRMDPVAVKSFWSRLDGQKDIVNATGLNQPLVPADYRGMVAPQLRRLTIRDLIPVATTDSNSIQYVKELLFTNNAAPQYSATSPPTYEGVAKPKSDITFQLTTVAVVTLAHWIAASRQVLSDAGMLRGYIENRLTYGLKLEEEDELLNSTGTNGELNGLRNQATAYSGAVTGDTVIDTLLRSVNQVNLSEFTADGFVLHPTNWTNLLLLKDTEGRYIFGDPGAVQAPRIWGLPVVPTQAMPVNNFLTGAFQMAAQIFDREDASVRIAEQHANFFVENMVAILAEERIALAVYRPTALVKGTL